MIRLFLFFINNDIFLRQNNIRAKIFLIHLYQKVMKSISIPNAPTPIGPYSQAILLDSGMLFISGQIPINPTTGELVSNDIKKETEQVLSNIEALLKESGMNFSNIVKTSIFLSDMGLFNDVNEIYATKFTGVFPARETIAVKELPKSVNVEISAIAVK